MVMFLKDMLKAMFFVRVFLKVPKHHFENCGKESIYPIDEDSVTFSLGLYMEETHIWFYVYKSDVEKYYP